MTEAFVDTETDRTKSKWVARVYHDFVAEFGRSRTTQRALFYYALRRKASDYPICGGFVGEIRITRPYHESDGEKLPKWVGRAKRLGFIPADAILEKAPGEKVFLPTVPGRGPNSLEVWLNKSSFDQLLGPVCEKHGATLVSVQGRASKDAIEALNQRCDCQGAGRSTTILCLSDLSPVGATFSEDLAAKIAESDSPNREIRVKRIGLLPEQVVDLRIPTVRTTAGSREERDWFKRYIKPYPLDPKRMAELDALEVYYTGGIAGFLDESISKYSGGL
ncbi:MAG TPA: hypothetical protein VLY86_03990 [Methanothrix sp.]|nr:hypothetical protein [Methanothrix sp.]